MIHPSKDNDSCDKEGTYPFLFSQKKKDYAREKNYKGFKASMATMRNEIDIDSLLVSIMIKSPLYCMLHMFSYLSLDSKVVTKENKSQPLRWLE